MRILLFLATNMAVLVLVSIVFNLLGIEGILAANGVDLNLGALLVLLFWRVKGAEPPTPERSGGARPRPRRKKKRKKR